MVETVERFSLPSHYQAFLFSFLPFIKSFSFGEFYLFLFFLSLFFFFFSSHWTSTYSTNVEKVENRSIILFHSLMKYIYIYKKNLLRILNVSTRWQMFLFLLFFLDWLNWLRLIGNTEVQFSLTLSVLCPSQNVVRFQFSYDKSLLSFVSFVGILFLSLYVKYIFERWVQIRVTLMPHNVHFNFRFVMFLRQRCKNDHSLASHHNVNLLRRHDLLDLSEKQLFQLLLQNDPWLLPDVSLLLL